MEEDPEPWRRVSRLLSLGEPDGFLIQVCCLHKDVLSWKLSERLPWRSLESSVGGTLRGQGEDLASSLEGQGLRRSSRAVRGRVLRPGREPERHRERATTGLQDFALSGKRGPGS